VTPVSLRILDTALRFGIGLAASLLVVGIIATSIHRVDDEVHPLLGVVPKAGQFNWDHLEGNGEGYWTSNGVRRAHLPAQRDGPPILLVGNSYTEGLQVTDEEHYGHLLENELRLRNKYVPVLTYGKSGASVADYVANSKVLQEVFKPRWTIIQVDERDFGERAWRKTSPGEATFVRRDGPDRIKVIVDPLSPTKRKSFPRLLAETFPHLVPYSLIYRRVKEFQIWFKTEKPWFRPVAKRAPPSTPGAIQSDYPVAQEMKMLAAAYGHRLTLLYLPSFDPNELSIPTKAETMLRNLADQEGIRFVSLRDKFKDFAAEGRSPYGFNNTQFNSGHWNRYGHEAAARLLLDDLAEMGL
jgi:hypothetical protein